MKMFRSPQPGRCASCELEISGRPISASGLEFCCLGCLEGGPCICSYEADLAEDGVDRLGLIAPIQPLLVETASAERVPATGAVEDGVRALAA